MDDYRAIRAIIPQLIFVLMFSSVAAVAMYLLVLSPTARQPVGLLETQEADIEEAIIELATLKAAATQDALTTPTPTPTPTLTVMPANTVAPTPTYFILPSVTPTDFAFIAPAVTPGTPPNANLYASEELLSIKDDLQLIEGRLVDLSLAIESQQELLPTLSALSRDNQFQGTRVANLEAILQTDPYEAIEISFLQKDMVTLRTRIEEVDSSIDRAYSVMLASVVGMAVAIVVSYFAAYLGGRKSNNNDSE